MSGPMEIGITVFAIFAEKDEKIGIAFNKDAHRALIDSAKKQGAYGVSNHGRGNKNPISGEMGFSETEVNQVLSYLWI